MRACSSCRRVGSQCLDGKPVAVKILNQEKQHLASALAGFKREVMVMTLMNHTNVLKGLALGQESARPFMVVERLKSVLSKELPTGALHTMHPNVATVYCPRVYMGCPWRRGTPSAHHVACSYGRRS